MPSILGRIRSVIRRSCEDTEIREEAGLSDEYLTGLADAAEEQANRNSERAGDSSARCDVCQKSLRDELLGGNFGGECRICGRLCCKNHFHGGLCPYCREKMGEKGGRKKGSSIF
ncbi:MAG: hypothetical protein JW724_07705 [Candidatus Altiarchaeota archaeon]|nr:hypothetical protein [Candidatus Altiarchaeota archaeon]